MLTLPLAGTQIAGGSVVGADAHASVVMPAASHRSSTYSADDGRATVSSGRSSGIGGSYGRVEKISRLEKLKSLPEALEEAVCNLPFQLDEIACTPMFREQMEEEACTVLDLSRLLERSPLPLFLRIHETKAATTHVLLLTAATGARRLDRVTRSALKLGWPRVTSIKIFTSIGSVDEELDYKIWMPRDYTRYFPNLRSISYVAYDVGSGYFREMCHTMGRQQTKAVVFRASQRHMEVLDLSARLMRYMAHANFLMTSLGLTISAEPRYPDYAFTVIRTVLLTDLAAPTSLRLNVDSTDLLYKITENRTLHFISSYAEHGGDADQAGSDDGSGGGSDDEMPFCKPSVRELTLRFREIGKLGIPFAARHFPRLERLVLNTDADVGHPSLENTLYGCMFLERWEMLRRVQLAHINDTLVQLLASSCPQIGELIVFNAATHDELMQKNSFDIHHTLLPLPTMPAMRFTPKSLHYLLTRFPHLRVLDLNYPLYVDPLTRTQDIDASLAASLMRAVETAGVQYPRHLRYLSLPFIPLTAQGIGGIVCAFPRLATLEVRLAAAAAATPTARPASASRRRQLLARVKGAGGSTSETRYAGGGSTQTGAATASAAAAAAGGGAVELNALWVWSDWSSATATLGQVIDLFAHSRRPPRVYIPYVAGVAGASEVETRLIKQYMEKEMPWVGVHRFEYNVSDYYT
ncbi:hypothetical protein GGI15_003746 [Coemansia interrupta]|uniref:Uncharacterized protein n=1 Tax=Coemansia interrupta TaxID=1126814 RepID=A0A9W8HCP6_9FUNG|nr:hypothetical protein GGI15_003746 [Coemansia interrupta]